MYKRIKRTIMIISVIALAFMIGTMVYATSFSVLVNDDFSHGVGVGAFHVPFWEYVIASLKYAKKEYLNWQGTFFSMFLQALLSPINNYGFRQLRCVMALNTLLFYVSLIILTLSCLRKTDKESSYVKTFIVLVIVFCFCGFDVYKEVFFWFSGATSYSFPLSVLLLAMAAFIRIEDTGKAQYIVLASVLGFLAGGGSLTVCAAGCFFAVLVCSYLFFVHKRIPVKSVIVTIIWIMAAGINAMAPGNFRRHGFVDDTGVHPMGAIYNAFEMASIRWQFFFSNTNIAFILFLLVLIGCYVEVKNGFKDFINIKERYIMAVIGLLTPIVTAFPAALGNSGPSLPNRIAFIIDSSIILSAVHFAILSGIVIIRFIEFEQRKTVIISLLMVMTAVFMLDGFEFRNIKIREVSLELKDHIYQDHYYACKGFLSGLEEYGKGEDVCIEPEELPEEIDNSLNFDLLVDKEHWINRSIAEYYGFNSISVYPD